VVISNCPNEQYAPGEIVVAYRVDGPIRNSLFLIWAKGEGGVSPSRTPILKKLSGNEKAISGSGPVSER